MCINVLAVCKTASTMPKNNDSLLVINTAWKVPKYGVISGP